MITLLTGQGGVTAAELLLLLIHWQLYYRAKEVALSLSKAVRCDYDNDRSTRYVAKMMRKWRPLVFFKFLGDIRCFFYGNYDCDHQRAGGYILEVLQLTPCCISPL